jgi:TIR domain
MIAIPGSSATDKPIEIFVSYACDDNIVSPGLENGKGFVSALTENLDYIFKRQGPPRIKLWWDERQLDEATRIDSAIEDGIKESSLLLVVMSRNWLSREWCRKELELFSRRQDDDQRIVLVRANHVELADHPKELQNIRGFNFYSLDNWRQAGNERLFFDLGKSQDPLFLETLNKLGGLLWNRANTIWKKPVGDPPAPKSSPQPQRNGRTIYLAKSAPDTANFYRRVANDLDREGYTIVPPVDQNIPEESAESTLAFIDEALKSAEGSIHLLGEKRGSKPDEELDYIVPLQLARATERAKSPDPNPSGVPFQRFIWAPKSPEEDCNFPAGGFREPVQVLGKFSVQRDGDQLYGDVSSAFLTNLKRDLDRRKPEAISAKPPEAEGASSRIYVWYRQDDRDFARQVRRWLQQNNVETMLPGSDNDPDKDKLHRMNLAECDGVFLCWAQATDVWAKMSARELRNWRDLGRKEKFSVRSLVLGPPPGESKSEDDLPSMPYEIDAFVDLSKDEQLVLDRLRPLLERSRPQQTR